MAGIATMLKEFDDPFENRSWIDDNIQGLTDLLDGFLDNTEQSTNNTERSTGNTEDDNSRYTDPASLSLSPPAAAPSQNLTPTTPTPDINKENRFSIFDLDVSHLAEEIDDEAMEATIIKDEQTSDESSVGFAKLEFGDGDYIVKSHDVVLCRDPWVSRRYRRQQNAQAAVELYRQEPPSTTSAGGGFISYRNDGDFQRPAARSKAASSDRSVDPNIIHADSNKTWALPDVDDERSRAHVPIHPSVESDINKISKQHAIISWSSNDNTWYLHILGNGAVVNTTIHGRGETVPLKDNDEIFITTVRFHFRLPGSASNSPATSSDTSSQDGEDTSEIGRNELAIITTPSVGNHEVEVAQAPIKATKKRKNSSTNDISATTGQKAKKRKTSGKEELPSPSRIEPGSDLANIPANERPEKKRGPGRPPANGVISKRDRALVERKKKEYIKQGLEVPNEKVLTEEVRHEDKIAREQKQARRNGDVNPGTTLPSIEPDTNQHLANPAANTNPTDANGASTPVERAARAPPTTATEAKRDFSPMPAKEAFTEEQLKKPNGTYKHLLYELLLPYPEGVELQQIYDLFKKRWPHWAFYESTHGWESSVRHNLDEPHFILKGKIGKTPIWAVNPDRPINKEPKRKKSPLPTRQPTMQHGQHLQQTGQYGNPYGGGVAAGAYYSPYGQPGPGPQPATSNINTQQPPDQQLRSQPTSIERTVDRIVQLKIAFNAHFQHHPPQVKQTMEDVFTSWLNTLSDAHKHHQASSATLPPPADEREQQYQESLRSMFEELRVGELLEQEQKLKVSTTTQPVFNGGITMTHGPPATIHRGHVMGYGGDGISNGGGQVMENGGMMMMDNGAGMVMVNGGGQMRGSGMAGPVMGGQAMGGPMTGGLAMGGQAWGHFGMGAGGGLMMERCVSVPVGMAGMEMGGPVMGGAGQSKVWMGNYGGEMMERCLSDPVTMSEKALGKQRVMNVGIEGQPEWKLVRYE